MSLVTEKIQNLSETVFDFLASGIYKKNDFSLTFTKRSIANSLYDQAPKIKSGLISVSAKKALEDGYLRSKLCYEHPYPRTRTTLDVISYFDTSFGSASNNFIVSSISKKIEKGSKVHLVLSEENQKLYPFQQDYTLSEEEIYQKAGIVLVQDDLMSLRKTYIFEDKKYYSILDVSESTGFTKYKVSKMIKNGEIKVE